jgi:hypothetical protein
MPMVLRKRIPACREVDGHMITNPKDITLHHVSVITAEQNEDIPLIG